MKSKRPANAKAIRPAAPQFGGLLRDLRGLIVAARVQVARAVDSGLVTLCWQVGRRIRQDILKEMRAEYGAGIVSALGTQLSREFGRGFNARNLFRMVRFAEVFPDGRIVSALRTQLGWTHFRMIVPMDDDLKRDFYAEMCRIEKWSTRTFTFTMKLTVILVALLAFYCGHVSAADTKPHIIFVMADDMGWGQTGYRGHPVLKTPHLDAMAANGLRFERFYAGGPVCSPTRASMLTGRSHARTGVLSHGYALRTQERTIAQALKGAGYVTGHFGKWHLNGHRGPGAPIFSDDPHAPGKFGFDEWVSVSNFYDVDPLMSRAGKFEQMKGDSSEVAVDEAVKFLGKHKAGGKPMFAVIWYGTPHSPFKALDADKAPFANLDEASANHYGELVAMDRSIGTLRAKLRDLGVAKDTLLVFCSDNGGLPEITPETVGGLRGHKASVFEGGIRVPGIIEWPAAIKPRVTSYPACVMDLFPTVADIVGLPDSVMVKPLDGLSLKPIFTSELGERRAPIGFRYTSKRALVDDRYKLLTENLRGDKFELYDLVADPKESRDLSAENPEVFARMKQQLLAWDATMDASFAGKDYPGGKVSPPDPEQVAWYDTPQYQPFLAEWKERWEYKGSLNRAQGQAKPGEKKKRQQ